MKGNTIDEEKMVQVINGDFVLYEHNNEHNNAEDWKAELLKLLSTITTTKDLENLDIIYLKIDGIKNSLENIFVNSHQCMMQLD